jgi:adenosylmethionine-8-amino-7-oxononanoate aminotransferase
MTKTRAVAETNLDVIEEEHLVERAARLETVLEMEVRPLHTHKLVTDVRARPGY